MTDNGGPHPDPLEEGRRIVAKAASHAVPLRLLGGVAVALRCPSALRPPLQRTYADIDLVTLGSSREETAKLMKTLGYAEDREFNALHGHRRLFFWDESNQRQIDVFVDEAHLCHTIDFRHRLDASTETLGLADLLMMKLQVVETNRKDFIDLCAILADHDLGSGPDDVDSAYLASLVSSDWGLWKTLMLVGERTEEFALALPDFEASERVAGRVQRLRAELDQVPKTRGWKMRARVGERKLWYSLPEEVN